MNIPVIVPLSLSSSLNLPTILVLAVLAVILFFAVRSIFRGKGRCSHCSHTNCPLHK